MRFLFLVGGAVATIQGATRNTPSRFMLQKPEFSAESFELVVLNP